MTTSPVFQSALALCLAGITYSTSATPLTPADVERYAQAQGWLGPGVSYSVRTTNSTDIRKGGNGSVAHVGAGGDLCHITHSLDETGTNSLSYSLGPVAMVDNDVSLAFSFFHEASHCDFAQRYRPGKFKSRFLDAATNERFESALTLNAVLPGFKEAAGSASRAHWHALFEENYADVRAMLLAARYLPDKVQPFLKQVTAMRQDEMAAISEDNLDLHLSAPTLQLLAERGLAMLPADIEGISDLAFQLASDGFVLAMDQTTNSLGLPGYLARDFTRDLGHLRESATRPEILGHPHWRKYQTTQVLAALADKPSTSAAASPSSTVAPTHLAEVAVPPVSATQRPRPRVIKIKPRPTSDQLARAGVTVISASFWR